MLHTITTYTTRYRWDTDADGDPLEFPTELGTDSDVTTLYVDDEEPSFVDVAAKFFANVNGAAPSQSPGFSADLWYSEIDSYQDPYTGVIEERTFHLHGFTVDEQRDLWARIVD